MLTPDITATIEEMRKMGQEFLDVPDSYYDGEFDSRVGKIQVVGARLQAQLGHTVIGPLKGSRRMNDQE